METFLESLWSQLEKCDGSMVWALSTSEEQLNLCRLTVERAVVGQIFVHAMYPNGEADISRDDVSFEKKLKFCWQHNKSISIYLFGQILINHPLRIIFRRFLPKTFDNFLVK